MKVNIGPGLRGTILFTYIFLLLLHLFFLFLGYASIITTLLFYLTAGLVAVKTIQFLSEKLLFFRKNETNFILFFVSLFLTLFACELFLKYAVKKHLSYGESNGSFVYTSPYREFMLHNYRRKFTIKQENCWLKTSVPNSEKIDENSEFSYKHQYNSEGLRDKEFLPTKTKNEYRIIGLGSSFTEGNGTHQDSTWLKFLENDLSEDYSNKNISTLNAGVAGSDPIFGYVLFKQRLLGLKPDLVTLTIGVHDIYDLVIRGGKERFLPDETVRYRSAPNLEFLYAFSFIFRHIIHNALNLNWTLMSPSEYEIQEARALSLLYSCILDFHELSKENNFNFVALFHPTVFEIIAGDFALNELANKTKTETKIQTLNLYDYYLSHGMSEKNSSEYYWSVDLHHNKKGYQLWADAVSQQLNQLDWIK